MSGHNKWSTIKHKKAKTDGAKSKYFTKAVREIQTAVRMGGSDVESNFRLRLAVDMAKGVNMPNSNIENAIKKAMGAGKSASLEEITYEGYGPKSVALMIQVMTDNKNRSISNVRSIVEKAGGNIGSDGTVAWMFDKRGIFLFAPESTTEEQLMAVVIEAGADDVILNEDGSFEVLTAPDQFEKVNKALMKAEIKFENAELAMLAKEKVELKELEDVKKIKALIDKLDDDDDVQKVFVNFECSDEILTKVFC